MSKPALVVGGDSVVGRALLRHLEDRGHRPVATTRREQRVGERRIHVDLESPDSWDGLPEVDSAILCAAVTGEAAHRRDPRRARLVNEVETVRLARTLADRGTFVVFLSSNAIFDGEAARVAPGTRPNPRTAYGRSKARTEQRLRDAVGSLAIVRATKIFWDDMPLLADWCRAIGAGERVTAYADYRCAPVHLSDAAEVIARVAEGRRAGVWQISPAEDVSYAEVARFVARRLEVEDDRVEAVACDPRSGPTHLPRHTTLDASLTEAEFGIGFPSAREVVDRLWDVPAGESS